MNGNLYFYQRDHTERGCTDKKCAAGCKKESLDEAIRAAVKHFEKKFGYYPDFAIVHLDDYVPGKYPVKIHKVLTYCQRSHFLLCPIVMRQARVFQGNRLAYKGA